MAKKRSFDERIADSDRKHLLDTAVLAARKASDNERACRAAKKYGAALIEARLLVGFLEKLADATSPKNAAAPPTAEDLQREFANVTGLPVKAASK